MNDELNAKLVEIITQIQGAVASTTDFAIEQIPDVAAQYVIYGRALESTLMLVFLLGLVLSVVMVHRTMKMRDWVDASFATVGACAFGAISVFAILAHLSNFFMVWLAPKVWLIQKLAELIK